VSQSIGGSIRLKIPRHFSIRPALIHVNGVEDAVLDEGYFDKVIDFGELLRNQS